MIQEKSRERIDLLDWFKGCAIIAVALDHFEMVPEPYVVWSVNLFVLVSAYIYSKPGYSFTAGKLALKIFQMLYLTAAALLFIKGLRVLMGVPTSQPLLSVFLNPYAFFVRNRYLGDIWYLALHIQFLVCFYLYLNRRHSLKTKTVLGAVLFLNGLSFLATLMLGKLHTILATSWLVFLAAGFYGMRPFVEAIEEDPHYRKLGAAVGFTALLSFYGLIPFFPELFTNAYRALFINIPFYAALVLFLSEMYFILEKFKPGRVFKSLIYVLGRHSFAIYLTHEPLQHLLKRAFPNSLLTLGLCFLSGIAFGTAADWLFSKIAPIIPLRKDKRPLPSEENKSSLAFPQAISENLPASEALYRRSPE